MNSSELPQRMAHMYDAEAEQYEANIGHGLGTVAEQEAWQSDLRSVADFAADSRILEVGAGTGALTRLLAQWGGQVVGLEVSAAMLAEATRRLPAERVARVEFRLGDTHQADLFPPASFDWLVSRHVVSHLYDPLRAFHNWLTWLRPTGQVLVVEGFWPRADWEGLADELPLSCLQTRATIGYLLEQAGFAIQANSWLEKVNAYWGAREAGPPQRYVILARRVA
jgi:ubiquinone/menaquinone biosynthesis C-methylase UbiE